MLVDERPPFKLPDLLKIFELLLKILVSLKKLLF